MQWIPDWNVDVHTVAQRGIKDYHMSSMSYLLKYRTFRTASVKHLDILDLRDQRLCDVKETKLHSVVYWGRKSYLAAFELFPRFVSATSNGVCERS